MAVRRVVKYGEKILKKKTRPVNFSKERKLLGAIITDMFDTMIFAGGMGLSANQINLNMRLTVIRNKIADNEFKDYVLINPEIVAKSGTQKGQEGCLSFPGLFAEVKRFSRVKVKALNDKGLPVEICADGLLARALEHEIDHLNGITFIERLPLITRVKLKPVLRKLKKEWARMDESSMAKESRWKRENR